MAVGEAHVFPGFLTTFFPEPPTTFLACFSSGERPKYTGKKVRLNRVSDSQSPGHDSDMFTTEPTGRGRNEKERKHRCLFVNSFVGLSLSLSFVCETWGKRISDFDNSLPGY